MPRYINSFISSTSIRVIILFFSFFTLLRYSYYYQGVTNWINISLTITSSLFLYFIWIVIVLKVCIFLWNLTACNMWLPLSDSIGTTNHIARQENNFECLFQIADWQEWRCLVSETNGVVRCQRVPGDWSQGVTRDHRVKKSRSFR